MNTNQNRIDCAKYPMESSEWDAVRGKSWRQFQVRRRRVLREGADQLGSEFEWRLGCHGNEPLFWSLPPTNRSVSLLVQTPPTFFFLVGFLFESNRNVSPLSAVRGTASVATPVDDVEASLSTTPPPLRTCRLRPTPEAVARGVSSDWNPTKKKAQKNVCHHFLSNENGWRHRSIGSWLAINKRKPSIKKGKRKKRKDERSKGRRLLGKEVRKECQDARKEMNGRRNVTCESK